MSHVVTSTLISCPLCKEPLPLELECSNLCRFEIIVQISIHSKRRFADHLTTWLFHPMHLLDESVCRWDCRLSAPASLSLELVARSQREDLLFYVCDVWITAVFPLDSRETAFFSRHFLTHGADHVFEESSFPPCDYKVVACPSQGRKRHVTACVTAPFKSPNHPNLPSRFSSFQQVVSLAYPLDRHWDGILSQLGKNPLVSRLTLTVHVRALHFARHG
ncbi:unnamed protein product [Larinioides sclopetarius]|uniref:Uncharacterized protein n=1 Tax=Larinioides sclopetarius TaxID=280406 RepID=A0AAV1ZEG8_9ARAC